MPFFESQSLAAKIQFPAGNAIGFEEIIVGGFGIPEVDGVVIERAGGIPLELSSPKVGIASEELSPRTQGP